MSQKTGNLLQEGLTVQYDSAAYAALIATALHRDLGNTHRAVKTIRKWTGAGERTATNWLSAENGPSGPHLALLAHHSDTVLEAFLIMAGRERVMVDLQVSHVRQKLVAAIETIDTLLDPNFG
ncbi:hypothetical protein [Labrenzia sp. R5_0]|uniref:hypothetical protein n=1 Tax=Labrenzia sp. R5_0 TaxID=2821108 RepID=UPI001ADC9176|nr:hypothetical protein [Labrenzia sp. R5_0]MBO9462459.1 hypothetical protein [Labrenzia sp. R5_0]